MNDRYRELAREAGLLVHNPEKMPTKLGKFAELVVRECARTAGLMEHEGRKGIGAQILDNFGVLEHKGWVCPNCGIDRTKEVCPQGPLATVEGRCPMTMEAQ